MIVLLSVYLIHVGEDPLIRSLLCEPQDLPICDTIHVVVLDDSVLRNLLIFENVDPAVYLGHEMPLYVMIDQAEVEFLKDA